MASCSQDKTLAENMNDLSKLPLEASAILEALHSPPESALECSSGEFVSINAAELNRHSNETAGLLHSLASVLQLLQASQMDWGWTGHEPPAQQSNNSSALNPNCDTTPNLHRGKPASVLIEDITEQMEVDHPALLSASAVLAACALNAAAAGLRSPWVKPEVASAAAAAVLEQLLMLANSLPGNVLAVAHVKTYVPCTNGKLWFYLPELRCAVSSLILATCNRRRRLQVSARW